MADSKKPKKKKPVHKTSRTAGGSTSRRTQGTARKQPDNTRATTPQSRTPAEKKAAVKRTGAGSAQKATPARKKTSTRSSTAASGSKTKKSNPASGKAKTKSQGKRRGTETVATRKKQATAAMTPDLQSTVGSHPTRAAEAPPNPLQPAGTTPGQDSSRDPAPPAGESTWIRPLARPAGQGFSGSTWRRLLHKGAIIFGPSLLLVLIVLLFPGIRGVVPDRPQQPPPTNLLPSVHDRVYLSPTLFLSNHIVGYYGHPTARFMGIVGRYPMQTLGPMLRRQAAAYDAINGDKGTVPAFYLIYGTAQPGGNILIMESNLVDPYIRYTATNGYLLILDHQIGKYTPRQALTNLLPFLKYPHIHLAIDPEWRTTRPMQELGRVYGSELNELQSLMRTYILTNRIPGKRMLIVHQFENKMIQNREAVSTAYDPVVLVHSISGWGTPGMKYGTYKRHSVATNMPVKGFKLWYDPGIRRKGLHFDYPLMSPQQVLDLKPEPMLILYQ